MTRLTDDQRWTRRLEKEVLEVKRSRDALMEELRAEKKRTLLLENKFRFIANEVYKKEPDVPRIKKILTHGITADDD